MDDPLLIPSNYGNWGSQLQGPGPKSVKELTDLSHIPENSLQKRLNHLQASTQYSGQT